MGFGLLFVGYFISYVMSYVFIPKLLGCIIMLAGVLKLSEYELEFKKSVPLLGAMSVTSAYMMVRSLMNYFGIASPVFGETAANMVSLADEILCVLFHVLLLLAIKKIAKDTGLDKLCYKTVRNLLIVFVAEIAWLSVSLIPDTEFKKIMFWIAFGLRAIWIVINLMLLVSCYRFICDESDVDMPDREINIPIIKQMEKAMQKRDKNAFDSGNLLNEKRRNKKQGKKKK